MDIMMQLYNGNNVITTNEAFNMFSIEKLTLFGTDFVLCLHAQTAILHSTDNIT